MDERRAQQDWGSRRAAARIRAQRRDAAQAGDDLGCAPRRRPLRPRREWAHRHIQAGSVDKDVTFVDADHNKDDQIDAAYRGKYRRYAKGIVDTIVTLQARAATLKVLPRS
jgi:hypothetical protein